MNRWIDALRNNSLEDVKLLIADNEDVNDSNESGESVLAYALRSRCDFEIIDLLIQHGADMLHTDYEGVSVFEMAITYNNHIMVQKYLQNGIDVNQTKKKKQIFPTYVCRMLWKIRYSKETS